MPRSATNAIRFVLLYHVLNATLRYVVAAALRPICYVINGFWKRGMLHYAAQRDIMQTCCGSLCVTLLCNVTTYHGLLRNAYELYTTMEHRTPRGSIVYMTEFAHVGPLHCTAQSGKTLH
eukprot:959641-Pyramimonas_sp.AAC.2